jgi:hypothetical protein
VANNVASTIAALTSAVLIAGCSSSTQGTGSSSGSPASSSASSASSSPVDADALRQQVAAAMKAASTFHLVGNVTDDNGKPLALDIHFGVRRTDGSITQNGQKIELINPGGASVYFRAPDALWRQYGGAAAVALLHGKWVKVPAADKRFAELASSFDKDNIVAAMTSDGSSQRELRKVGTSSVGGVPATEYKSSAGSQIYLAATGSPVILKIADASSGGGTMTFSDYGKPYPFAPPPASETVDFAKLEGH